MADLTSRIIVNSVLGKRKVFLKNVFFISKATWSKLQNLLKMVHSFLVANILMFYILQQKIIEMLVNS